MRRVLLLILLMLCPAVTHAAPDSHEHAQVAPAQESLADYLWRKSDDAFHAGDYERAIKLHRAIVVAEPDDTESYGVGAWLLWSLGRGDEATAFIEQGLKANPNAWEMWDTAGQHFDLLKQDARAATSYKRAVELLPADEPSMLLRRRFAHASERAGDLVGAVEVWRGLLKDFPDEAVHKNNLARVEKLLQDASPTRTSSLPLYFGFAATLLLPAIGARRRS